METTKQTKKGKDKELCFKKLLYACVCLYDDITKEEEGKREVGEVKPPKMGPANVQATT